MHLTIGNHFELEIHSTRFFLRVPFIGQCFYSSCTGWAWDSWARLKETGEA